MANLYTLPSGTIDKFNVVIEIPAGSQNKYEYSPDGFLELDRVLYSSEFYPFNYGFVPNIKSIKAPDGDLLDVAVWLTNPVPPATVVKCRAIGILKKIDSGDRDDCILAVPVSDPRFADIKDIGDLQPHTLKEMEDFFANYKRLQNKTCQIIGFEGKIEAEAELAKYLDN